ncbi:autotransporter outer membrane beta-barrel domain-containing protein [Aequorivita antarctica]|uniref:Uncharacterized protein n=1 Tax=Aequorivita antarctica TaxID=153266 RepID=A0A5C6YZI6_9FLAO|nr:hypothetical protein [Aequorivita antarctica]TXD72519.1 hypothetical protein ESU54_11945 [Aequorivita antarctica]SRX75387.1 hypothetical protein AEQU3_02381 [Aequorivita antarctica]
MRRTGSFRLGVLSAFCLFSLFSFNGFAQVGIGTTTPDANALLDVDASTTVGGLLLPRVSLSATNNFAPLTAHVEGMTVYNIATAGTPPDNVTPGYYYNDGGQWIRIAAAFVPSSDWTLTGNTGTTAGTNFLGTIDNVALRFKTFNVDRFEISSGAAANRGRLRSFDLGTDALPTYSWTGDVNTGIYSPGADQLSFSTNGLQRFTIPNAYQVHANSLGTNLLPFYSFSADPNTGFYSTGADQLGFSTAGAERMRILANGQIAVNTIAPIANTRLTVIEAGGNRSIFGNSVTGEGIRGESTSGDGVIGLVTSGRGVYGQATSGTGVSGRATSANARGGYFLNIDTNGYGLWALGGGTTLYSFANSGTGAAITGRTFGATSIATAVDGEGIAGIGDNIGGLPTRPLGLGVVGYGYQAGVFGDSGYFSQIGVHGRAEGLLPFNGIGVYGENVGSVGMGVAGESTNIGVYGNGAYGGIFEGAHTDGFGAIIANITGSGANRIGLVVSGQNVGITTLPGTGAVLAGDLSAGAGFAENTTGTGLIGVGNNITTANVTLVGSGVAGTGNTVGIYGKGVQVADGIGVVGLGNNGLTYTIPANGAGVAGTGANIGVFGHATNPAGFGVYSSGDFHATGDITTGGNITTTADVAGNGFSFTGGNLAITGDASTGGNLMIGGNFSAAGSKAFIIDDPRDPANKYLKHFNIESDEILNLYRGVATFDASGEVVVQLPDYYDAINKNASYQLTPIGAAMPNLYIATEVTNGSFVIAGGVSGKKVSWTLTAERNDPYVRNNPEIRNMIIDKGADRGRYLSPEAYGQSADKGIFNNKVSEMRNASTPIVAKPAIATQEMQSKTVQAIKLDSQTDQNLTAPLKKSRTQSSGEKVLRDVPNVKAQEMEVSSKTLQQEGSNTLENEEKGSEVPQQTSESEKGPTKISETQDNK